MTGAEGGDQAAQPSGRPRWSRAREIIAVVLLSVTAILTAWCGFESSKWGGAMSIEFSQASSARIRSADLASESRDARAIDLAIYSQWIQARAAGDETLAAYIEARFTPEFAVAFEAWQAGEEAEPSPFATAAYVPQGTEETAAASATADAKFDSALVSNQRGDNYGILTVLFALVLFFTAVSERARSQWAGWALLGLGATIAVAGGIILATFPILI